MSKQSDIQNIQSIFAVRKQDSYIAEEGEDRAVRPWVRMVARAVMFFYCIQLVSTVMPAYAQVAPNSGAPAGQRPIMDAAQNGVPIVNIAPPSAAGVSRNQYNQFNVNPNGLILNNSRSNTQTQLGGWIAGNPQMGASPARIILNEVVSGNASSLRGTIEVAGQKAAIVIANPNGVTCDGCGFLNTDRASLVAGTPQFGTNGSLNGFNVGNGQLNVGALGLNAANVEQLDLIARGIVIEGEVWAKNLNVIAGNNQVLYGTLQSIAQNGSGTAPSFAIDIKELGGMYANQIYMVATEQGLGVNSTGRIAALQGNLTLSANGDLGLADSYAKQNLQIAAAGNIALKNKTIGDGTVRVAALGNLDNLGIVFSGRDLDLKAAQMTDFKGKLMAARNLSLQANAIALNETTITADGNAILAAAVGNVEADKVKLYAGGNLDIAAAGNIVNGGGAWQAAGNATLQANSIDNRAGNILANQALSLTTANGGLIDNQAGTLVGNTAVALSGSEIRNAQGTIATDGTLQVDTKGAQLDNTDGNIQAVADTTVAVASLKNANGTLDSGGNLTLGVSGDYSNQGVLSSDKDMTVNAANIANSGTMHAGKKLVANTGNFINDGELSAGNPLANGELDPNSETTLNLSGTLTNNATGVVDGSKTTINANTVNNTGRVYGDSLKVQVDTLNNSGTGVVAARENMSLGARSISNTDGGLIYSLGDIAMARSVDNGGQATGEVETLLNASAKIEAAGNITIAVKDLINRNDELTTTTTSTSTPITKTQIQPLEGDLTKYDPSSLGWSSNLGRGKGAWVYPSATYPFAIYGSETREAAYTGGCNDETGKCNYHFEYANSDPIWALFGVAPAQAISNAKVLNAKILAFNNDLKARSFDDWYEYTWTRKNVTDTVLASTHPAEILAGKALTIDASNSVLNDNSSMVAGGAISMVGASVENRGTQGTRTETDVGTYAIRYVTRTTNDPELDWYPQGAITGAPVVTTTTLQAYTFKQNAAAGIAARDLSSNAGSSPTKPLPDDVKDQLNGQTQYRDLTIPDSSLFKKASPGAAYLVETDPRFINKKNFLSSDYYLSKLGGSPDLQLKRYGDGFVEQQLVNDQILALTGRRYLSGYTSTEEEYKGLMDAGIAFAQQYQISPGVTLSAEQMALLTTDIVLLIKQPVTLADGSIQEVLVPQVYLRRPQTGDLLPSGGLIAGTDIYIKSAGDLVNTGQISANNENTLLAGNDLLNRDGRISGQDVYVRAGNDLKNISGTIQGAGADSIVALSAGRDVILETRTIAGQTERSATTAATSRVNADRIATVQGGTVTIDAGRDMIGKGSVVQADTDLAVIAGRDLKISAVETSYKWTEGASGRTTKGKQAYRRDETVTNKLATFKAGNNVTLIAGNDQKGDVALTGVDVSAGNGIAIQGSNVTIEAVKDSQIVDIQRVGKSSYNRDMAANESLTGGNISAINNILVIANGETNAVTGLALPRTGNVKMSAATVEAKTGQVGIIANNDVVIEAMTTEHSTARETYKKSSGFFSSKSKTTANFTDNQTVEGSVISGSSVVVQAGSKTELSGDLTIVASKIAATDDLHLSAGRDIKITAADEDSSTYSMSDKRSSGLTSSKKSYKATETAKTKAVATSLAAKTIALDSGQDTTVIGSHVNATGQTVFTAGRDITVSAAEESQSVSQVSQQKKSGFSGSFKSGLSVSSSKGAQTFKQDGISAANSSVSGSDVAVAAARDVGVLGSVVLADQDIRIQAGRNVNIDVAQESVTTVSTSKNSSATMGFSPSISGNQTAYGTTSDKQAGNANGKNSITSLLSANAGDLTIVAGGESSTDSTISTRGADLLAGKTITLEADRIQLLASRDTAQSSNHTESKSFTIGSKPAGVLGTLANTIVESAMAASEGTGNSRLDGALALKAGYDSYKLLEKAQQYGDALKDGAAAAANADMSGSAFGVSVSIGSAKSSSDSKTSSTSVIGTNLQAKDINLKARETDILLEAAKLQATNINIDAARDVVLVAAANTSNIQSKNSSSSASVGATLGGGQQNGLSFQLGMQTGKGKANGEEITYDNTLVTATDNLKIKSGNDTTLQGAQLAGKQVTLDVGNNLSIETLQDISKYKSEQKSGGFGISLCIPPICYGSSSASVNLSEQKIKHDYQSAQGQSGIAAGSEGFDITVGKNTDLVGAAITSTAKADDNRLTTGSLTSRDLTNVQDTTAKSSSFSATVSYGNAAGSIGSQLASNGAANLLGNLTGQAGLPKDEHQISQTLSVISPAQITLTGSNAEQKAQSEATVAVLTNRDPATSNQALTNSLTLQQTVELEKQLKINQQNQQAAQMVGVVLTTVIGDLSISKTKTYDDAVMKKQALEAAIANGNNSSAAVLALAEANQVIASNQDNYDLWKEGGPAKIALHGLAGFLQGQISGTNSGAAAFAAMSNEALTAAVNKAIDDAVNGSGLPPEKLAETKKAYGEAAATLIGALAGAVVGGTNGAAAGGTVALIADQNNRQLHPLESKLIKDNAKRFAQQLYGTTDPTAEQINGAFAMLANTAQNMLDNNIGYDVPKSAQAQAFLNKLQAEFAATNPSTVIPGSGGQFLFYATPEQKSSSWINADKVDKEIAGVIIKASIKPSNSDASSTPSVNRDRLTGRELDNQGRYSKEASVDGVNYQPKFWPCGNEACVAHGSNFDMNDPETVAFLKATDKKILSDIGNGATLAVLANPVGAVGAVGSVVGTSASIVNGLIDDQLFKAIAKEALQAGAARYLQFVYKLSEAASTRITALVDMAGGWDAFLDRAQKEIAGADKDAKN